MKFNLILVALTSLGISANAVVMEVTGKDGKNLLHLELVQPLPSTVGKVSIAVFTQTKLPFQGSEGGISELAGLGQENEIISKSEMKAWGWCFALDGVVPDTLTNQTPVIKQTSKIEWFYAYAHYKDGDWIEQCARPKPQSGIAALKSGSN